MNDSTERIARDLEAIADRLRHLDAAHIAPRWGGYVEALADMAGGLRGEAA